MSITPKRKPRPSMLLGRIGINLVQIAPILRLSSHGECLFPVDQVKLMDSKTLQGIHRKLRSQKRPCCRVLDQGRRGDAELLGLVGRALGSPAKVQPCRKCFCHALPSNLPHQGRRVVKDREADGLHPLACGIKDIEPLQRCKSVATRQMFRWGRQHRSHQKPASPDHAGSPILMRDP